ncbi:hypothetical protein ABI_05570 [Asticcacaulis biprosthecium C19]|uniref:Uncharacterized protein n=1 Tax=Asticcacaulis biprosthecium C19 TaxID=715226 RepID=F4QKH2_9CAUL|nr:ferredoxin [Asticcacaulis biprosthecium]EGF92124.1 hypothetical protein ABI_05570 [Asticcacaulis biprosthecium C19]
MRTPYLKNVPGDFYVEDQCCVTCNIPLDVAPDLFTMDDQQCYVSRQPRTADELDRTLRAMNNQELDCIRYSGQDREIVRRLVESGEGCTVDSLLTKFFVERLRHIARVTASYDSALSFVTDLLEKPRALLNYKEEPSYKFSPLIEFEGGISLQVSWFEENWHTLSVSQTFDGAFLFRLEALSSGGHGFSRGVHHWLSDLPGVSHIRWLSQDEFDKDLPGQPAPF